jgi:hypothetical protein
LANNACGIFGGPISQHVRVRGRAAKSRPVQAFSAALSKISFISSLCWDDRPDCHVCSAAIFGCGVVTVLGLRQSAGILERNTSLQYDGLRERYIKRTVRRATIRLEDLGYAQLTVPQIPS